MLAFFYAYAEISVRLKRHSLNTVQPCCVASGRGDQHFPPSRFCYSRRLDTLEASTAPAREEKQNEAVKELARSARCVSQALPGAL